MTAVRARIDHRRLMTAVLDRAVRDVRETRDLPPPIVPVLSKFDKWENARHRKEFHLALEVRSWFDSDRDGLFSFRGICDALNINAKATLRRIAPFMPIRSEAEWREYEAGTAGWRKSA